MSKAQAMPRASSQMGSRATSTATTWRPARLIDLTVLHGRYLQHGDEPFFIEISGPDLGLPLPAFVDWCRSDAAMYVAVAAAEITGFLWFSYIQKTIGVANVDWTFFPGHAPNRERLAEFRTAFKECHRQLGLHKTHVMALPHQSNRIHLAQQLGFIEEGILRSHFFHGGRLQDLHCFGRWSS